MLIDALARIIHVSTAITLVGGTIFMLFVLYPAASQIGDEEHRKLRQLIVSRWKKIVHAGIALFLISGFYNYFTQSIPNHKGDGLYHALLGIKMLVAFVIFFLASVLVGRSTKFEAMRQNRAKWMGIIVLLAAIVIAISGFVKVRPWPPSSLMPTNGHVHTRVLG